MGKIKNIPFRVFCYVLMIVFLFIYLFPLFFVANTSLKTSQDYMLHPTSLTTTWAFDNTSPPGTRRTSAPTSATPCSTRRCARSPR